MVITMDNSSSLNMDAFDVREKKGFSGSTLKLIAIVTMLIDHTAATILDRMLIARGMGDLYNAKAVQDFMDANWLLYNIDHTMRMIGRLGFPLFCFLLVEGFLHTRNILKYTVRLAIFAIISEIPFDLALFGTVYYPNYQNVFFTLFFGMLVMIGFKAIAEKAKDKKWLPALAVFGAIALGLASSYAFNGLINFYNSYIIKSGYYSSFSLSGMGMVIAIIFCVIALLVYLVLCRVGLAKSASVIFADFTVLIIGMFLAEILKTDYSGFGVLTIAVMYALRRNHFTSMLGGCITLTIMFLGEAPAFFALIPAKLYNGERGLRLKYVFYLFYPVHLFILYLICYFMGIV